VTGLVRCDLAVLGPDVALLSRRRFGRRSWNPGSVRSRTPPTLRSSAARDRSAGRARQGRCRPRRTDPQLAKPARAGSLPAEAGNGAGQGYLAVVRGCPLGTGQDRREWHASGTAGEGNPARTCRRRAPGRPKGGPPHGDPCSLASRRDGAAVSSSVSPMVTDFPASPSASR
jgi:hypothetical protein